VNTSLCTLVALVLCLLLSPYLAAYPGGADPYAAEYADVHEALRYPVMKSWQGDEVVFDNFRVGHVDGGTFEPQWTTATVDLSKIRQVSFMLCVFDIGPIPAGHGQMVFEFDGGGCRTEDGGDPQGLVASFEAYRGLGQPYSALKGLGKTYRSIWVLDSFRDAVAKAEGSYTSVEFFTLRLPPEMRRALLENYLRRAFDRRTLENTWYDTVTNSCLTSQFDVLGEVLPYPVGHKTPTTSLPGRVPSKLRAFGRVESSLRLRCPDELRAWFRDGTVPAAPAVRSRRDAPSFLDLNM